MRSVVVQNLISGSMFLICYCDYGDIVVINSDRLKVLPASFRTLPALAISARLSGNTTYAIAPTMYTFVHTRNSLINQALNR